MMKVVATLLCLVAVTQVSTLPSKFPQTPSQFRLPFQANFTVKQMEKIHSSFVNCTTNLNIPEDTVHYEQITVTGNLTVKDAMYKRNLLCLMQGMRIAKPTGDIDVPNMREFLRDGHDEKSLGEMLEICAKTAKGATPEEKAYQFHQCFWTQDKFVVWWVWNQHLFCLNK